MQFTDLKDTVNNRIAANQLSFGMHMAAYAERFEQIDYLIHALQEEIDHKAAAASWGNQRTES
jgi:hypothetical protein